MNRQKGFTLIELLVVIAIIGILSSVVLASLNTARGRSANAAIKSNLANVRAQAELFYDTTGNSTYGAFGTATANCLTTSASLFADTKIRSFITSAQSAGGGTALCASQPLSNSTSFVISVQLKQTEGTFNYWCVDSSGSSKGHASAISGSLTACP